MVSILLPTYNGQRFLDLSINSVLEQSFKDIELLIGLNGSNYNSLEIIQKYNDKRVRVFDYGDDKGKSKTLNKLLNESKYNWIALQDDDDVWVSKKIETQMKYIHTYDVIGTFINYIDSDGQIIGYPDLHTHNDDIKRASMNGINQIANTSAIFKKSDAIQVGGWREDIDGIEDYDFWLKLMRQGKTFINIPEKLVLHRIRPDSNFNTKKYDLSKILK